MRKPARKLLESITRLRATIRISGDRLGSLLADRHAARRDALRGGASPADYGSVFDHFAAELQVVEGELTDGEDAYQLAERRAFDLRQERNRAALDLQVQHTAIERFCRSQPQLKGAGVVGPTPKSADALARQVPLTVEFLRDFDFCPQTLVGGARIDAGALADDLEAGLLPLEGAIEALHGVNAEVDRAREWANRAFAEAGEVLSWVARTYESLGGLAGEYTLANRVRRSYG